MVQRPAGLAKSIECRTATVQEVHTWITASKDLPRPLIIQDSLCLFVIRTCVCATLILIARGLLNV